MLQCELTRNVRKILLQSVTFIEGGPQSNVGGGIYIHSGGCYTRGLGLGSMMGGGGANILIGSLSTNQ